MIATGLVATLTHIFAPWQQLYSDSKAIDSAVVAVHLVGILVGGGLAIAADRATLRVAKAGPEGRPRLLDDLHGTHRPVMMALVVVFASGLALATSDIPTFSKSPVFLVKLILIALLCVNGAFLYRTESQMFERPTEAAWRRLLLASRISIVLWCTTVIAGATLANS